MKKDNYVHN